MDARVPADVDSDAFAEAEARRSLLSVFERARALFSEERFAAADDLIAGFNAKLAAASTVERHGPTVDDPEATVVVISYRQTPLVVAALEEIAFRTRDQAIEIVLVQNGNTAFLPLARDILASFVGVTPPFPVGASAGRNVGACFARAPAVVFLEDDGIVTAGCVDALVGCLSGTGAIAVRGRVRPLTSPSLTVPHYDLGERRIPALITCEGVSAWRRREFLEAGGFNPLLYGHEGLELCGRLWRFHGPAAFVYEPSAVLLHDYAANSEGVSAKKARYALIDKYIAQHQGHSQVIHAATKQAPSSGRLFYLSAKNASAQPPPAADMRPVSVITTARNAARWLDDYSRSWQGQTHRDFQLVFVDDGSGDGTAETLRTLWRDDPRLTLIERPFGGRGASLNVALAHAQHDLCLIADADDVSVPSRIARTVDFFARNPDCDYLSFLAFTEHDHYRIGPPREPHFDDMRVRALFGMPASFPTFAFRRSRFGEPFDETLRGGIDCDWLRRNLAADISIEGRLVHVPLVYYRQHDDQITKRQNGDQQAVRKALIYEGFARLVGELSDRDRTRVDILVDLKKAGSAEKAEIGHWLSDLLIRNEELGVYDQRNLTWALLDAFDRIAVAGTAPAKTDPSAAKLQQLRLAAEKHIANGDYKQARIALRSALQISDDPAIRRRLRAAHRYGLVRALARSRAYAG